MVDCDGIYGRGEGNGGKDRQAIDGGLKPKALLQTEGTPHSFGM